MSLYRVEIIEKDVIKDYPEGLRDVCRISSPAKTIQEATEIVRKFLEDFKEEMQEEKYYISIYYYTIEKESK